MKRWMVGLAGALFLLGGVEGELRAVTILQPWTLAETSVMVPSGGSASWLGNTLTLTYDGFDGANAAAGDWISLPNNAIGISFGVSGTLDISRASLTVDGWDSQYNFIRQLILTNEINVTPDGQVDHRYGDLSDWSYGNVGNGLAEYSPWSETTNGGVTSLLFPFTAEVLNAPHHRIYFMADGRQSVDTWLPGTTSYSDVSWILSDSPSAIPESSTFAMFLGLGGMGLIRAWRRHRRAS